MSEITIKLPDIGEGIAEAEIADWAVTVGQWIHEDDTIGTVLTDKAAVEIPSGHAGKVTWLGGEAGDKLAVGAVLIRLETDAEAAPDPETVAVPEPMPDASSDALCDDPSGPVSDPPAQTRAPHVLAAAAVRGRARDLSVDLATVPGSGPDGRVTHGDLDRMLAGDDGTRTAARQDDITQTRIIGLRRKIAESLARSHAHIPQITIIEEVDVTELQRLRAQMNSDAPEDAVPLTLLPFLARGLIRALSVAPQINGRYDDDAGVLHTHSAVHLGVATQTDKGLVVPVVAHAETRDLWDVAADLARLATAARDGSIARDDLRGATITITSLGPLGAVATTPIVNHPELAIVGVNRIQTRPLWDGRAFQPRAVMNLSASFDHRIIDGWDAAQFVARLKSLLETPALLFT